MNDLMSGGIHRWWKAEMIAWLNPRPGQTLLDVAGGTGDIACRALKRLRSGDRRQRRRLRRQRADARDRPRPRASTTASSPASNGSCGDAEALPFADRSVDLYTIAFGLRNVTRIERALAEARRVLKPGGRFLCLEFTPAVTPLVAAAYDLYSFRVLPLLGQIVTGDRDAYTYLVESIRRFPPQSELASDDRGGGARAGAVSQPDRRHRRAPFGLAALTRANGLARRCLGFSAASAISSALSASR